MKLKDQRGQDVGPRSLSEEEAQTWGWMTLEHPVAASSHSSTSVCAGWPPAPPGSHCSQGECSVQGWRPRQRLWESGGRWPRLGLGWWRSFHLSVRSWSRPQRPRTVPQDPQGPALRGRRWPGALCALLPPVVPSWRVSHLHTLSTAPSPHVQTTRFVWCPAQALGDG